MRLNYSLTINFFSLQFRLPLNIKYVMKSKKASSTAKQNEKIIEGQLFLTASKKFLQMFYVKIFYALNLRWKIGDSLNPRSVTDYKRQSTRVTSSRLCAVQIGFDSSE